MIYMYDVNYNNRISCCPNMYKSILHILRTIALTHPLKSMNFFFNVHIAHIIKSLHHKSLIKKLEISISLLMRTIIRLAERLFLCGNLLY